VNSSKQQQRIR